MSLFLIAVVAASRFDMVCVAVSMILGVIVFGGWASTIVSNNEVMMRNLNILCVFVVYLLFFCVIIIVEILYARIVSS